MPVIPKERTQQPCEERSKLSHEVTKAIAASHDAKTKRDLAAQKKQPVDALSTALLEARKAERVAISTLDKHRKEHRC